MTNYAFIRKRKVLSQNRDAITLRIGMSATYPRITMRQP